MVAAILAFGTFLYAWLWFESGQSCIPTPLGVKGCTFIPIQGNISFVSLALFCALLTCIESIIGLKSRKIVGKLVPEPARQHNSRVFGTCLIVVGAFIAFAGFYPANNTFVMCPLSGCFATEIMTIYSPLYAIFIGGMILVVLGDFLILSTKFMKSPLEIQHNGGITTIPDGAARR